MCGTTAQLESMFVVSLRCIYLKTNNQLKDERLLSMNNIDMLYYLDDYPLRMENDTWLIAYSTYLRKIAQE